MGKFKKQLILIIHLKRTIPFLCIGLKRNNRRNVFQIVKMNHRQTLLLLFLMTCYSGSLSAQKTNSADPAFNEWKDFFDKSYGPDYNLVNGIKYVYLFSNANGHPFLGKDQFYTGYAVINGRKYPDLQFKYDICNQQVILNYTFFSGGTEQIILNNEVIDTFYLNGKLFRKYSFPETDTKFLQVIESGDLCCLYLWGKKINYSPTSTGNVYSFTTPKKKTYLLKNDKIFSYKTKRSFLKLFPEEHQKQINQFIRRNNIWFKEAPDNMMHQLINFCDKLIRPGDD